MLINMCLEGGENGLKHWSDVFNTYEQQVKYAKKTLNIDYTPEEMCINCVVNHTIVRGQKFLIKCRPLMAGVFNLKVNKDNLVNVLKEYPYYFATLVLNVEPREFQKEIISCTAKRKVLRIQRRCGKTHALAMYQLWYQATRPRSKIRIVAPREMHVREYFDQMDQLIVKQPTLESQVLKNPRSKTTYSKNPYELVFTNKSTIRGTTTGDSDGVSVRSQAAHLLILDETDYISEEAFAAVYPLVASSSQTELLQASTPSGRRTYFYQWCHDPGFKEFHRTYQEVKEIYSVDQDLEFQRTLDKETYQREILAEFTVQEDMVFKNELIDKQLEDYDFDPTPPPTGFYSIGVDWNESVQGVHIVIQRYEPHLDKTRISNIVVVPPSEFTQLAQIQQIVHLIESYEPKIVVLDEGFGVTQIQALKKWANDNRPEYVDKIISVNFGDEIQTFDPISGTYTKIPAKMFMVQLVTRMLENGKLILPVSQDTRYKLVGQMRQYQVEKILENGVIKYTKDNVHTLESMLLQLYGLYLVKDEVPRGGEVQPVSYSSPGVSQIVQQTVRSSPDKSAVRKWDTLYKLYKRRW